MIKFILLIVGLIVLFYYLAVLIVKYVPRKVHWIISLALLAISAFLGYKIYDGVVGNIRFHEEKEARYSKVINNLKIIREAEVAYKKVKGDYTKDFGKLVSFIENDSFAIVRSYEKSKTVSIRGVEQTVEYKVVDTIGYDRVIDDFKNVNFKDMMKVPGTNATFNLATGYVEKGVNAIQAPVFEAKIDKKTVLDGLNKNLIEQEVNVIAIDQVRGKYISVGTLEDVKDSGNWPPSYDTDNSDAK